MVGDGGEATVKAKPKGEKISESIFPLFLQYSGSLFLLPSLICASMRSSAISRESPREAEVFSFSSICSILKLCHLSMTFPFRKFKIQLKALNQKLAVTNENLRGAYALFIIRDDKLRELVLDVLLYISSHVTCAVLL